MVRAARYWRWSRPGAGVLCAGEGPVRQANLPLRQRRPRAARAVLVFLLEEGQEDEEQVCGEGEAGGGGEGGRSYVPLAYK